MVLTCQERYAMLTTLARPHLLGYGLITKLHSEIYMLGNSRATSSHLEIQKCLATLFTHVFFLLTILVPVWPKALWKISTSPLSSPRRKQTTSQWMIEEPAEIMDNTPSHGITPVWNLNHAERAVMKNYQYEYSKRESKDFLLALNADSYWCWKPTSVNRYSKHFSHHHLPSNSTICLQVQHTLQIQDVVLARSFCKLPPLQTLTPLTRTSKPLETHSSFLLLSMVSWLYISWFIVFLAQEPGEKAFFKT